MEGMRAARAGQTFHAARYALTRVRHMEVSVAGPRFLCHYAERISTLRNATPMPDPSLPLRLIGPRSCRNSSV